MEKRAVLRHEDLPVNRVLVKGKRTNDGITHTHTHTVTAPKSVAICHPRFCSVLTMFTMFIETLIRLFIIQGTTHWVNLSQSAALY